MRGATATDHSVAPDTIGGPSVAGPPAGPPTSTGLTDSDRFHRTPVESPRETRWFTKMSAAGATHSDSYSLLMDPYEVVCWSCLPWLYPTTPPQPTLLASTLVPGLPMPDPV